MEKNSSGLEFTLSSNFFVMFFHRKVLTTTRYESKYKCDLLLMYSGKSVFAPYPQGDEKGALSSALRGRVSWPCSDHKP